MNNSESIPEHLYHAQKEPRFGTSNPEKMNLPFWTFMVQQDWSAWQARSHFDRAYQAHRKHLAESLPRPDDWVSLTDEEYAAISNKGPKYSYGKPVWCFQRFGMAHVPLPDGRQLWIAGEHEDYYDPDFYIYNDVIVIHPDASIDIYGYPPEVFPPTDFHTATLVGESIYLIGSMGYLGSRQPGETPVYRLHSTTFQIEKFPTSGEKPGWISSHTAEFLEADNIIQITDGRVYLNPGEPQLKSNRKTYWLDLATGQWLRD